MPEPKPMPRFRVQVQLSSRQRKWRDYAIATTNRAARALVVEAERAGYITRVQIEEPK